MKSNNSNLNGNFVPLFGQDFLDRQRIAGKCVEKCLVVTQEAISSTSVTTTQDLEELCLPIFKDFNCTPTFFNYQPKGMTPFSGKICVSVNDELVHGIPKKGHILHQGDLVKVDLGATYQGAIADAARTSIFGQAKEESHREMVLLCKKALQEAIKAIKIGHKIGVIGHTIYRTVKGSPYRLITEYGGHGISFDFETKQGIPHSFPFIANKAQVTEGVTITPGMTFAIEPLVKKGDNRSWIASDGWTIMVDSFSCHEEHTVFITEQGAEIIA